MDILERGNWINGKEVPSESGEHFEVNCPCKGNTVGFAALGNEKDIQTAISATRVDFESPKWSGIEPAQRGCWLWKWADLLEKNKDHPAKVLSLEVFSPVLCIIPYEDEEEGLSIANDTEYDRGRSAMGGRPCQGIQNEVHLF